MENECNLNKFNGCCCECKFNIQLNKHPFNKELGAGMMSEKMGYACIGFFSVGEQVAHFFEKEHGMCELFQIKQQSNGN